MLVGVAPEDPEVTGVGGPTVSAGLSPPDVDEEGDLTLPCNQPNQRALLSTQSPPPNHHQTPLLSNVCSRPKFKLRVYTQAY